MKRKKAKAKTQQQQNPQNPHQKPPQKPLGPAAEADRPPKKHSRRRILETAASWGFIAAVGGTGAWWLIDDVLATTQELDLSKIGNGIPAIVQIHDPQCPRCRALQTEAREAMKNFDDDELLYLVANIRQPEGRDLAAEHGVGHVTLLFLDGHGKRRSILAGENSSDYLASAFRRHVARYGKMDAETTQ